MDGSSFITGTSSGPVLSISKSSSLAYFACVKKIKKKCKSSRQCLTWTDVRRPVLRPWIRSAEVRGERRYVNGNTTTTITNTLPAHFTGYVCWLGKGVGGEESIRCTAQLLLRACS